MIGTSDAHARRAARRVLVAIMVLATVAGVAVHQHAWIAAAGSGAMLSIGTAWPWLTVRALRVGAIPRLGRMRAGEVFSFAVPLHNRMPLPACAVAIELGEAGTLLVPIVGGLRRHSATLELRPDRRGIIDVATARVACAFPFGLSRAERAVSWRGELIVWPARVSGPFPSPRRTSFSADRATRSARAAAGGDELAGIRGYRAGDPMRHVHWKATARHDRLISRESHDGPRPPTRIVLDLSVADDAACERAIARATGAAEHYVGQGFRVELIIGDRAQVVVASDSPVSLERLLDAVARLDLANARLRTSPSASIRAGATLVVPDADVAPPEAA